MGRSYSSAFAERFDVGDLLGLLPRRRADQLDLGDDVAGVLLRQEGVDANQGQRAVVLLVLVVEALFLDLAALVHRVHGAEHAAAVADGLELARSEEHTSELQSRENLVCRLLLEKKNSN